ncbi:hypothetical protein, partial [Nocardia salmonicida]|uniref:hypothetical protein n=1 Tax=Nocardia salmonicida TaxID=53431 RepID=UPI001BDE7DEE
RAGRESSSAEVVSRIHGDIARLAASGMSVREMEPLRRGLVGLIAEMSNVGNSNSQEGVDVDINGATADELFEFIDNAF